MQHLEVSCAVRPIQWSLGVKWLTDSQISTTIARFVVVIGVFVKILVMWNIMASLFYK